MYYTVTVVDTYVNDAGEVAATYKYVYHFAKGEEEFMVKFVNSLPASSVVTQQMETGS
jgi:hypothetical protein